MMVSDRMDQLGRQAAGAVQDASRELVDAAPTVNELRRRQRGRQRRRAVTAAAAVTGLITVALVGVSQLEDQPAPMVGDVPEDESSDGLPDGVVATIHGDDPFTWQVVVSVHDDAGSPAEEATSPREDALSSTEQPEWCVAVFIEPDQTQEPDSPSHEDCGPLQTPDSGSVNVHGVFSEADGATLMWGRVATDATAVVATLDDGELREATLVDGHFEGQLWVLPYQGEPGVTPSDMEVVN